MKAWSGRFSKELDETVNDFNQSISFDKRLYKEDIQGSIAHANMLGKCGIISEEESKKIIGGLNTILEKIEKNEISFSVEAEDIHMNIEMLLTELIGDTGKKLHTARSRNDQVALDMRLYIKKDINIVKGLLGQMLEAIVEKAEVTKDHIMPAYTHLQRAQPVTFAFYILAYAQMFKRDIQRLNDILDRMDYSPLGSGALATTTYPIDRNMTAAELGFKGICENSIDGVSDRDYLVEYAAALSLIMVHLSRFSEEIILWCSSEFSFITLDDAYSTGSSIMPQKKNPDIAELCRGKSGRVFGDLTSLLTMLKGLPLAYNKDMQEDKEAIFDASDTVKKCLAVFRPMIETMAVNKDKMLKAASKGFINATDCADYLVKKGLPFRDAYTVVGKIVAYCERMNKELSGLTIDEFKSFNDLFDEDVYKAIDLYNCVNQRKVTGGPSIASVEWQIEKMKLFLDKNV